MLSVHLAGIKAVAFASWIRLILLNLKKLGNLNGWLKRGLLTVQPVTALDQCLESLREPSGWRTIHDVMIQTEGDTKIVAQNEFAVD